MGGDEGIGDVDDAVAGPTEQGVIRDAKEVGVGLLADVAVWGRGRRGGGDEGEVVGGVAVAKRDGVGVAEHPRHHCPLRSTSRTRNITCLPPPLHCVGRALTATLLQTLRDLRELIPSDISLSKCAASKKLERWALSNEAVGLRAFPWNIAFAFR
uniref:Uncharacterized protein n=1 Tax=Oryza nivara TaxID=4536 RepID=A0A0E0HG07_ORYNI